MDTPPAMLSRVRAGRPSPGPWALGWAIAWMAFLPTPSVAQAPFETDQQRPTRGLRDRYKGPQNTQKLSDNVRKLQSEDADERLQAISGLGEMNDPKATDYLVASANDPDPRIRIKAIDTLGRIQAKEATPLLIQQLFMRDTDLGTKQRILVALGKIGDPRATNPIIDFMSRDLDPAVRGNAIFALGDIGDRAALPSLEALSKETQDPNLRGLALEAIRKIHAKPAPSPVPPTLANDQRKEQPRRQ
jgi:HEAT repeat protein